MGCASPPATLDSPDPGGRMEAIRRAAEQQDRSAIPGLIRQLESDDALIRLSASRTLERLTGQTMGYRHSDPEWRRRQAVDAWVQWMNQGGLGGDAAAESSRDKPEASDGS